MLSIQRVQAQKKAEEAQLRSLMGDARVALDRAAKAWPKNRTDPLTKAVGEAARHYGVVPAKALAWFHQGQIAPALAKGIREAIEQLPEEAR